MNQPASRAMIVEFIGTPGAGKTTLMPVAKEFFASHGLHTWSVLDASRPFVKRTKIGRWINSWAPASLKSPILWQAFYLASKMHRSAFRSENRELLETVLKFQRTRPISRTDQQHVLRWFINLTGQYHFLNKHAWSDDVLIFDEGFIHRVVQLFASEYERPDEVRIHSYLSLIPVPDLIISPQASLETCIERVYRRGLWRRFKGRDMKMVSRFLANAHDIVDLTLDYVYTRGWQVIQIANENQREAESAQQLQQRLSAVYVPPAEKVLVSLNP